MPHMTLRVIPIDSVIATTRFVDRALNLRSLADDDPAQDAAAPQPVLLALAAPARDQATVRFWMTNDPRGPTNHVSDLSLRVPHDTIRWTCLYGHKPLMMATNMVMLMRERSNGECSGTHYYGTLPTSGPTRRFRMSSRNGEEAPRREEKGEHELPWFVWRTSEKPLDGEPI